MDSDRIRAAAQLLIDAALASGPPRDAGPPFARLWERYFTADVKEQRRSAKDIARIGRHLKTCSCSTYEAREMVREIASAAGDL